MRLIDADELFKWYTGQRTKYPVGKDAEQYRTLMMYEIFDEIDTAPTIDPVQRGRWRPHFTEPYENEGEVYWWVCSECEEVENRKSDYCPNCGSYMMNEVIE